MTSLIISRLLHLAAEVGLLLVVDGVALQQLLHLAAEFGNDSCCVLRLQMQKQRQGRSSCC
jgi:hypothetical protein